MRYTVASLHKALGKLIEQGEGRKSVCVDKSSFSDPCESDGVTILDIAGLGIEWIYNADGDGGIKINKDGSESGRDILVLVGSDRANTKGEVIPINSFSSSQEGEKA